MRTFASLQTRYQRRFFKSAARANRSRTAWSSGRPLPICRQPVVAARFVHLRARSQERVGGSHRLMSCRPLRGLIAPQVTRAASFATLPYGRAGAIQAVAPSLSVELRPVDIRDAGELERAITTFAASPNGGLFVTGSAAATIHRQPIVALAARHQLPTVYYSRYFVTGGGLISYGPDYVEQPQPGEEWRPSKFGFTVSLEDRHGPPNCKSGNCSPSYGRSPGIVPSFKLSQNADDP
jgi:hypothetical protein